MFLKVSGAAHLSGAKILKNDRGGITRRRRKLFVCQKKIREGSVLLFLKVSGTKKTM